METVVGIVFSVVGTWFFAWWYFKRAGDELRDEAAALHKAIIALVNILQNGQTATIRPLLDERGRVANVEVSVALTGHDMKATSGTLITGG